MLQPFLLLLTHTIFLQKLSLIKSPSVVLIKTAVDAQCYWAVGLLRKVRAVAGFLCAWKQPMQNVFWWKPAWSAAHPLMCQCSCSLSRHNAVGNVTCRQRRKLCVRPETVLPGVVVGSPCQLITFLWGASRFSSTYCVNDGDIHLLLWWADLE